MTKSFVVLMVLTLALSLSAFGQLVDPVGFCAVGGDCFTGTGLGSETIAVSTTQFQMEKNGDNSASSDPWYLLVAVPELTSGSATAPVITSVTSTTDSTPVFTQNGSTTDVGAFGRTQSGDIYAFSGGLTGDNSMNAPNLFCDGNGGATNTCTTSNEVSAFGSEPVYFEIFKYSFSPAFVGGFTPYIFDVGGSGLVAGTFLAAGRRVEPLQHALYHRRLGTEHLYFHRADHNHWADHDHWADHNYRTDHSGRTCQRASSSGAEQHHTAGYGFASRRYRIAKEACQLVGQQLPPIRNESLCVHPGTEAFSIY